MKIFVIAIFSVLLVNCKSVDKTSETSFLTNGGENFLSALKADSKKDTFLKGDSNNPYAQGVVTKNGEPQKLRNLYLRKQGLVYFINNGNIEKITQGKEGYLYTSSVGKLTLKRTKTREALVDIGRLISQRGLMNEPAAKKFFQAYFPSAQSSDFSNLPLSGESLKAFIDNPASFQGTACFPDGSCVYENAMLGGAFYVSSSQKYFIEEPTPKLHGDGIVQANDAKDLKEKLKIAEKEGQTMAVIMIGNYPACPPCKALYDRIVESDIKDLEDVVYIDMNHKTAILASNDLRKRFRMGGSYPYVYIVSTKHEQKVESDLVTPFYGKGKSAQQINAKIKEARRKLKTMN